MAVYPGAIYLPLDAQYLPGRKLYAHNRCQLHVAVSNAKSLFSFFNQPNRPSSHFYIRKDGIVEQYVDTDYRAEADLEGNDASISVETQGAYPGGIANTEPWTPEQLVAIAKLFAWLVKTHGIAAKMATSSQRDSSSHGLSWHRLGIDGAFPPLPSILAGRIQRGGGMRYSYSRGKACPGNAKIEQIPGILSSALLLLSEAGGGSSVPKPPPVTPPQKPKPQPKPKPPTGPNLTVDGKWGTGTTKALQKELGTTADGEISHQWKSRHNENIYSAQFDKTGDGSELIREVQRRLKKEGFYNGPIDGLAGEGTIKGLQRHYGTPVDGIVSEVSSMVKAMQKSLNAGKF
jgi:hypothetical protein